MSHTLTKSSDKTSLPPQTETLPSNIQNTLRMSHHFGSALSEKMDTKLNPAAVGTRGTVGALVMQEIDYFNRLELGGRSRCNVTSHCLVGFASTGNFSRPKLESAVAMTGKKKR